MYGWQVEIITRGSIIFPLFKNIAIISKKMCFFRKTKNSVYSKNEIKGNRCTFCTKKMACYLYSYTKIHKKYVGYQKISISKWPFLQIKMQSRKRPYLSS